MTAEPERLDKLEDALLELGDAERVGLFRPTPMADSSLSVKPWPVRIRWTRSLRVWAPIAAMLVIAAGVWTRTFQSQLGEIRARAVSRESSSAVAGVFTPCLTGPTNYVPGDCMTNDYDGDGDVDLADFRAHQLGGAVSAH